jgi:hypothetical protein
MEPETEIDLQMKWNKIIHQVREKEQQIEAYKIKDFRVEETYKENFKSVALPNLSLCAHLISNWQYNLKKTNSDRSKSNVRFFQENT